jgi:enoyl-CoA hydratase/carnithine racemase
MEEPLVERVAHGAVTILTMRFAPYNLIGPRLTTAIAVHLEEARRSGARAVVIRSGLRHFSAGAEIEMLDGMVKSGGESSLGFDPAGFLESLEAFPLPIVASVHGVCVGGGLELALACDYVVAAESSRLGSVEVTLGLHPLMGAVQRYAQRVGALRAKELAMLGRRYDAATLERWGLINLVVASEQLDAATLSVAEELANGPTAAHAATKRLVQIAVNEGVAAADRAMADVQRGIWSTADVATGLKSYLASGPGVARFEGH